MCKRIRVLVTPLFIFGVACHVADQREATSGASKKPTVDPRMEELKYSQLCTQAAEKFWNRHDWKDQQDLHESVRYTSHYNKNLNKCLVDVHGIELLSGEKKVSVSDHVYDALEDTILGGRVILRKGRTRRRNRGRGVDKRWPLHPG
jgi:glutaredoxin 2